MGDWENDLQHGNGIFYFADSSCFQGVWVQVTLYFLVKFTERFQQLSFFSWLSDTSCRHRTRC